MTHSETDAQAGPVQVRGTVLTVRRVDAYYAMTLVAPAIAARFKPGQFVTLAVGGPDTSMLLSRAFSIHDVRPDHGGTVEFVFAVHGRGTQWLAERRARDVLDVTGPLGKAFPLPRDPVNCLLIGGGYGSAPLFSLAGKLKERRCEVDFLLGAGSGDRVFGALTARRTGRTAVITTEDGSLGSRGVVTDLLDQVIHDGRTDVIYACGPMAMLRQITVLARRYDIPVQAAVEEAMACGIGVCMTCVLPVIGADGITRMSRACMDGPVFRGESVRWDDVGTIPFDAFGAPGWEPRSRRAAELRNGQGRGGDIRAGGAGAGWVQRSGEADHGHVDGVGSDGVRADSVQSDSVSADSGRVEGARGEGARGQGGRADSDRADSDRADSGRADSGTRTGGHADRGHSEGGSAEGGGAHRGRAARGHSSHAGRAITDRGAAGPGADARGAAGPGADNRGAAGPGAGGRDAADPRAGDRADRGDAAGGGAAGKSGHGR